MLHYIYIKFRAQNFHYVSKTPMEILSQDFISEFHLLFQQRIHSDFWWSYSFTAAFSDTWHWYSYSFIGQMIRYFWIYTLFALSFYTQNVKIYSESFHVRFVQRGDLWKQTTRQLQMGYIISEDITQKDTIFKIQWCRPCAGSFIIYDRQDWWIKKSFGFCDAFM